MEKAKPKLDERLLCINQADRLQQWTVPQFLQGVKRHGIGCHQHLARQAAGDWRGRDGAHAGRGRVRRHQPVLGRPDHDA
jgi:hypothetical protein